MRTTVTIDDDVLLAAKQLAHERGTTIGTEISELARASLRRKPRRKTRNGILLLAVGRNSRAATMEDVNDLRDEVG